MKRKVFKRLMAASLAAVTTVSLAGCGDSKQEQPSDSSTKQEQPSDSASEETPADEGEVSQYPVLKDENGNIYDLDGMEIIIRNWWASDEETEPRNEYEEVRKEYLDWCMDTYNFTIKEKWISDWANSPQDFQDYVTTGGDDVNYLFTVRECPATTASLDNGLMYDLSTLDCLDFTEKKFTDNNIHKAMSRGNYIGCMLTGKPEPRNGIFFNKRLVTEAGINPDDIYTWQENGEWTWDKFEEVLGKVQRDIDGDGITDIWGIDANWSEVWIAATCSNGGEWVGVDDTGHYVYRLEDPETLEALEWLTEIKSTYKNPDGDLPWDWYKDAFLTGKVVFQPDHCYIAGPGDLLSTMTDEYGFVCFPKGPRMDDYVNIMEPNEICIPGCYDPDRAWKIAFAYNLYTDPVPGWEEYEDWTTVYQNYGFDLKALDYTIPRMMNCAVVNYAKLVQNIEIGDGFTWNLNWEGVSPVVERVRDPWKSYIEETNKRIDAKK